MDMCLFIKHFSVQLSNCNAYCMQNIMSNVDEGDKCKLDTVLLFSDFKSSDGQKHSNISSTISNKSVGGDAHSKCYEFGGEIQICSNWNELGSLLI